MKNDDRAGEATETKKKTYVRPRVERRRSVEQAVLFSGASTSGASTSSSTSTSGTGLTTGF